MVMEYMQGGNLAAALAADNPDVRKLAWYEKGKPIAQGVASGLAYLHARKVYLAATTPLSVVVA